MLKRAVPIARPNGMIKTSYISSQHNSRKNKKIVIINTNNKTVLSILIYTPNMLLKTIIKSAIMNNYFLAIHMYLENFDS